MKLDIISYFDVLDSSNMSVRSNIECALLNKGIVGISNIPEFESKTRTYLNTARQFSALNEDIKQKYVPDRDTGKTEGYELGAEWFKDENDKWRIDDKKASYYAFVPDHYLNIWPREVDLKTSYLDLGELIFKTGKLLLNFIGLTDAIGLTDDLILGYGRMLHYRKENDATNSNPNWCGAHFDHGIFTGLIPAYYFRDGKEIDEPEEAGLYIVPSNGSEFEKIYTPDKSVLLFQVGEFGQLLSHDRIKATKHMVKKAKGGIERFTFALFYNAADNVVIKSNSTLIADERYSQNISLDGNISYGKWSQASMERYRVK